MTIENNEKNNVNLYSGQPATDYEGTPSTLTGALTGGAPQNTAPTVGDMHKFANELRETAKEEFAEPSEADFTITATKRKTYRVNLVGEMYSVAVPKTGALMKLNTQNISTNGAEDIEKVLSILGTLIKTIFVVPTEATRVLERLEDETDELDIENIYELINKLQEIAGKAVNLPPTR